MLLALICCSASRFSEHTCPLGRYFSQSMSLKMGCSRTFSNASPVQLQDPTEMGKSGSCKDGQFFVISDYSQVLFEGKVIGFRCQQFQKSKFKTKQSQAVFRYAVKQFDKGHPDKSANLKWLVNFGFLCQLPDILTRPSVHVSFNRATFSSKSVFWANTPYLQAWDWEGE